MESESIVVHRAADYGPRLPLGERMRIRWRHRGERDPEVWSIRVRFDELIAANEWDLATNFDDLNDRFA